MNHRQPNHHVLLWSLFLLGFAVRAYGLSEQQPLDDEAAAASAASNYLSTGLFGQVMWYHPPLRNFVIFLSGKLFGGYTAWGLRFGSVFLGSLTIPALGYLAYNLFRNRTVAFLAAFFLCVDPLHIALSREAFQESTTPFFMVAGVLAACQGIKKDSVLYCHFSGVLFGIATASKWHGLFPWAASALAYLAAPRLIGGTGGRSDVSVRASTALSAFVAVPFAIYLAAYLPWLNRGYSLAEFAGLQISLIGHHQYLHVVPDRLETTLSHEAYLWFLRPVAWTDFVFHQGKPYLNIAVGNYLVWALTLPSLYFTVRQWVREKIFEAGFSAALFLTSYLPLVLTRSRGIWVFSAPAVIPFAFLLSSYALVQLVRRKKISRMALSAYLAAVVLVSALSYPMSTFRTLEFPYLKPIADYYSPHANEGR